ncbi:MULTISPECIES: phosphodiesterase [Rhizobium]|uniref:3',5'-cyclic-nucleotide phosphodiesterase n=1 Tax=Rhizobium favelukesii TaxID=348824 RepID=W6RMD9_9HYPH|nr:MULTISPECIES: phosphodiesterase [Rhizobium]MCA0806091.1 phosphodiesterase [Rhizobium sp. T1473]MCS0462710.1 phosphodiesterase [Rhizobium favelukesii]UFS85017.1 phosphodiesterase [Rhizobium sp. T136]CDM60103.1 3',5'-cyclic-nucleotide phosphodiesterase [Rhizobium favelukesii]
MKLIHLTDLHLVPPGAMLFGFDPAERLSKTIARINRDHADAELCVVTGDLTDEGDAAAYDLLRDVLQELRVPTRLLLGNHDHRANFLKAFPDEPRDRNGFVQSVHENSAGRLIFLDTLVEGFGHGSLGDGRLEWLLARLAERSDVPVYLFAHHQLQPIGMAHFEPWNTENWRSIMEAIVDAGNVRHIFHGHVHVDVGGTWSGIPFSASRGVAHQIVPHFTRMDAEFVENAPAFDVALIDGDGVLVHRFEVSDKNVVAVSAAG